ncbi:hypothetical protein A3L11_04665 [Thermococcus siculi]|uniref:KaiC-like domain-containing protein n=1 Tax=Thermococcus siculi TaxID=72803 RepID=A0A2Z2MM91_9EURY|nr:DUF257 family protein [Thermococcus siculi]ASJ08561.1 hypothetical protein A3L11_04665 [Thermococcus siculi]
MEAFKKPVLTTKNDMDSLLGQIWPGGMTIIENSASFGGEFILHSFIHYSKRKGMPLVVEDIFDTLQIYATHLELMGVSLKNEDMKVIKVGGVEEVGDVIGRIQFENDPHVYQQKLEDELRKVETKGPYIHLVLGLERLLALQDSAYSTYTLLNLIRRKLGDKRAVNVYLIETSIVEGLRFNPLPMLEDIATSVAELLDDGELIRIKLRKSVFTLTMQKAYILVSPREILRWWE